MKILIVHDWAIVRSGIKQVLADEFGPQEIKERASLPDGFDIASGPWDLSFVAKRWVLSSAVDLASRPGLTPSRWGGSA